MQTVEYGGARKEYSPWFGRGFIQITWQEIYAKYEEYAEEDFTSSDTAREKLEKFPHCIKSAFWFYNIYKNVSKYAKHDDFNIVVALINGGFNGYLDRLSKLSDIISILSAQHLSSKIKNGVFPFSSSEIYNYRVYSYSWGRYHDPNLISVKGTNKNSVEAFKCLSAGLNSI